MDESNFSYYTIQLDDIWEFERSRFLTGIIKPALAKEIRSACEAIITREGRPAISFVDENENRESSPEYLTRILNQFLNCKTEEDRYRLEYFISGDYSYTYLHTIPITKDYEEFDFFFSLKLNQYQYKLTVLDAFLNFHLKETFHNEKGKFTSFLILLFRQYKELFHETVIDTVMEWIESLEKLKIKKIQSSNKNEAKQQSKELNSFTLKSWSKNKNYFVDYVQEIMAVILDLKAKNYVAQTTKFEQFKYFFQNSKQLKNQPIVWVGTNIELQWFIKILTYDLKLVEDVKNDKWLLAVSCFRKKDGKSFEVEEIVKATGKKLERKYELRAILEKL